MSIAQEWDERLKKHEQLNPQWPNVRIELAELRTLVDSALLAESRILVAAEATPETVLASPTLSNEDDIRVDEFRRTIDQVVKHLKRSIHPDLLRSIRTLERPRAVR